MTPHSVTRDTPCDTCVSHGSPYPTRPDPTQYVQLESAGRGSSNYLNPKSVAACEIGIWR